MFDNYGTIFREMRRTIAGRYGFNVAVQWFSE